MFFKKPQKYLDKFLWFFNGDKQAEEPRREEPRRGAYLMICKKRVPKFES